MSLDKMKINEEIRFAEWESCAKFCYHLMMWDCESDVLAINYNLSGFTLSDPIHLKQLRELGLQLNTHEQLITE